MKLRIFLILALLLLIIGGGALYWLTLPLPSITIASLGGDYAHAQEVSLFRPFTIASGVQIHETVYGGDAKEIAAGAANTPPDWDVVDADRGELEKVCAQGKLETLDDANLPQGANRIKADEDFVPGAIGKCWVGSLVYSHIVAYPKERFSEQPATIADFFDLGRFPGSRGLRLSDAQDNLAMALMADGVVPRDVYATLATADGANRAFAKLDTIKDSIVWYTKSSDPMDLLTNGHVVMSTALNSPIFTAITDGKRNFGILWDGQRYEVEAFGILKGSLNRKNALDFIRFATGAASLAGLSEQLPYGPARHSALPFVGKNPDNDVAMTPFMPTAPENFHKALAVEPTWWAEHGDSLQQRWDRWASGQPN